MRQRQMGIGDMLLDNRVIFLGTFGSTIFETTITDPLANVTIQQTLSNNVAIELGYVNAGGHRLPITTNSGYNNEWFCTSSRVQRTFGMPSSRAIGSIW